MEKLVLGPYSFKKYNWIKKNYFVYNSKILKKEKIGNFTTKIKYVV